MTWNFWTSCFHLPSTWITDMHMPHCASDTGSLRCRLASSPQLQWLLCSWGAAVYPGKAMAAGMWGSILAPQRARTQRKESAKLQSLDFNSFGYSEVEDRSYDGSVFNSLTQVPYCWTTSPALFLTSVLWDKVSLSYQGWLWIYSIV